MRRENCLNQDLQEERTHRIRNTLLIQSAPGKHHARESAPTGKEVSDDRRPLILEILLILDILIQTDEDGQAQCLSTPYREERAYKARLPGIYRSALAKRAYPVHRDREVSPTGELRARLQSAPTRGWRGL